MGRWQPGRRLRTRLLWLITSAVWTGTRGTLTPVVLNGKNKWLLYPLEVPVANGRIAVTVQMSGTEPNRAYSFHGVAKWFENGTETSADVAGNPAITLLTLYPGWNLLSLPSGAQDESELDRMFTTPNGMSIMPGAACSWNRAQEHYTSLSAGLLATQGF